MDLHKVYYDSNDVPRTVMQMVKYEPEWAANRLQEGEKAIAELAALKAGGAPAKQTGNTGSPQLPSIGELEAWCRNNCISETDGRWVYDWIARQLRASA